MHKFLTKIRHLKTSGLALPFAILHFLISTPLTKSFFTIDPDSEIIKRNIILIDILFFVALFGMYYGLVFLIRHRQKYKSQIRFALIYFGVLMLFLLLTWPGIWRGPNDDFIIATDAKSYMLYGWHHSLTSILYMVSFRFIPLYSGVIIIQCILITLLTTYLYYHLSSHFKISHRMPKFLLLIPFFMPTVIDYALYPLRVTLYGYFVVMAIFLMLEGIWQKRLSRFQFVLLIISFTLAITWRSEGIPYLVIAIIYYLYLACKKYLKVRPALLAIGAVLVCSGLITNLQESTLTTNDSYGYKVLATSNIMKNLVLAVHDESPDDPILARIDKVLDVDYLLESDLPGNLDYYFGGYREDYSAEEYNDYMKAFIELSLKYPSTVLKTALIVYIKIDTGYTLNNTLNYTHFKEPDFLKEQENKLNSIFSNQSTTEFYLSEYGNATKFLDSAGPLMMPYNDDLRSVVISLLEGKQFGDYTMTTIPGIIFWNLHIPLLITIVTIIFLFIKKKWREALVLSTIFIKTIIVFLTSPISLHMYYYAEYLLGYLILFTIISFVVESFITSRQKKKKAKISPQKPKQLAPK